MLSLLPVLACALLARSGLGSACDPAYAGALSRAGVERRAWRPSQALSAYEEALERDPTGFDALLGLAEGWNLQGESGPEMEAEEAFHRALGYAQCLDEAYPFRPEGPFWAAASYGNLTLRASPGDKVALSRLIAAESRRALARDPDHAPALVTLGIYERELARLGFFARMAAGTLFGGVEDTSLEESERLLRRAVELDPGSSFGRYELALTLIAAKKEREAAAELRRVLDQAPASRSDVVRQVDARARVDGMEERQDR
jgi:tetratricopeptide (TPR) repeat protein